MPLLYKQHVGQNGLYIRADEFREDNEWPGDYTAGGNHPVHLGDYLGDQKQYRVLHKLGVGRGSLVWLCRVRDSEPAQYVAVKIITAYYSDHAQNRELEMTTRLQEIAQRDPEIAEYCCLPLDKFRIEGPNGSHQCFVYPVAGPSLVYLWMRVNDPDETLQKLARQAAEAMAALHRHGICHGDFRPENILLRLDLSGMTEKEVIDSFHEIATREVEALDGYETGPHAPRYVVFPPDEQFYEHKRAIEKICLIDFGEAYLMSDQSRQGVHFNHEYAAPELILEVGCKVGKDELMLQPECGAASNIWALACTMFRIRAGHCLFWLDDDTMSQAFHRFLTILGPLPEPWFAALEEWKKKTTGQNGVDTQRRLIPINEDSEPQTIRGQFYSDWHAHCVGRLDGKKSPDRLSEQEIDIMADLIQTMVKYDPKERPSAEQVLRHPWFTSEWRDGEADAE